MDANGRIKFAAMMMVEAEVEGVSIVLDPNGRIYLKGSGLNVKYWREALIDHSQEIAVLIRNSERIAEQIIQRAMTHRTHP